MNIDSMIQGNPQALVTSYNGVLVADSLEVAERFGKSHKNVLQTIDNLVTNLAAEFSATNAEPESYFIPSDYQNRGKTYKKYLLTRDGFSLLVMGFTGPAGLTVITGPSDAGKTAIIRALRWFAFNEPTGEAFLHTIRNPDGSVKEAVDQVKVSVTFDNGITITKTRRKGKTTYTHSAFPTAWEKAEIPPEIKETLGLVKQQYGDFETCLNFAFQLDAPFMLSESASVGAKVLGKLAGTEIVDKSISEVNKKTHQTRSEISYADKQIGEIDVSLTEYFDLDRFDAELKIAEAAFTKLKEDQSRHVALTALMNSYQLNTEQRIKYYDEVERLAGVVVASVSLGIAEREQAKKEKLEDLNAGFWKAVQDQNEPLRVIHITRNLEDLQADLKEVETDVIRYDALLGFQYGYINLQEKTMSVKTTTVYNCDYCQKQLPDDYATTNGEGKGYYVKKAHDTIPLDTPIAGCTGIVVEVTLGTPKDDHHFTDLCDDCRLKFLKMAVEHLERKVAAEKEGLNNDGEETDV